MIKKRLEASVQSNRNKFTFTLFKRIFFTNRLLHRKINYIQECNFHFQHRYLLDRTNYYMFSNAQFLSKFYFQIDS